MLAGTRLLDLTNRPTAYADEMGRTVLASPVIADSGGRATAYLPTGSYDYVVAGATAVAIDAITTESLDNAEASLTWDHTASGESRIVLVAVAWQDATLSETIEAVTYAGFPMTRLGGSSFVDLFYLVDPPTGTRPVVVTWSGSDDKGAAAAAISLVQAAQGAPPAYPRTASGGSSPASVVSPHTSPNSLVVAALGLDLNVGSSTATPAAGWTSRWNLTGGSSGAVTSIRGGGITRAGDGTTLTPSWTLSPARNWGTIEVEVLPAGTRLYVDESGTPCVGIAYGINALDYPSLQEAIDALPPGGGVIRVPAGTYRLRTGLVITRGNVTLLGEGSNTVIRPDDPTNLPIDLLTVRAPQTRLIGLQFDGAASSPDLTSGTCGIVFDGYVGPNAPPRLVQHCFMENVVVTGCSRYGVLMRDTILMTAINCEIVTNKGGGLRLQGTMPGGNCDALRFIACAFSSNGGIGVDLGDALVPPDTTGTGMAGITFLGCTIQSNEGSSIGNDLSLIGVAVNAHNAYKIEVLSCYFEDPPEGCEQFIRLEGASTATIDNCLFAGNPGTPASGPDRAIEVIGSSFVRCSSNTMQGFKTEILNFDVDSKNCVEMCNRDLDAATVARITAGSLSVFGTSQQSVTLPRYSADGSKPAANTLRPGSMIWVVSPTNPSQSLQVSDGTNWIGI